MYEDPETVGSHLNRVRKKINETYPYIFWNYGLEVKETNKMMNIYVSHRSKCGFDMLKVSRSKK